MSMRAVRNIRLCTKDCLCLYVCPTGATDTENGQIDWSRCLDACHACVDACPSGAIFWVPDNYPPQQEKKEEVLVPLRTLLAGKARQELAASAVLRDERDPALLQLTLALKQSIRVSAEDLAREAGYMLPQSAAVRGFLRSLLEKERPEGFPEEAVKRLLELLPG